MTSAASAIKGDVCRVMGTPPRAAVADPTVGFPSTCYGSSPRLQQDVQRCSRRAEEQFFNPAGYPNHVDVQYHKTSTCGPVLSQHQDGQPVPSGWPDWTSKRFTGLVDATDFIDLVEHLQWMYFTGQGAAS